MGLIFMILLLSSLQNRIYIYGLELSGMRSQIEQKSCRGLGAAVGPQSGCRGEVPAGGLGALPPEAEEFVSL